MRTADFDYQLLAGLIAQTPAPRRDASRLLVLPREPRPIEHRQFRDLLEYLRAGDVLVLNNSRVIPARLRGVNAHTGGEFELLLLEENAANDWWAMLRPGKRARPGTAIALRDRRGHPTGISATVLEKNATGHRRLRFAGAPDLAACLDALGEVPLPPYISRPGLPATLSPSEGERDGVRGLSMKPSFVGSGGASIPRPPPLRASGSRDLSLMELDRERYQTVFAQAAGSVAAPTAGLHFTSSLLDEIRSRGVQIGFVTLHVGVGTFAPVKTETIAAHTMHAERYELSEETARLINAAKREGRRVVAVGTTTLRVLESLAQRGPWNPVEAPDLPSPVLKGTLSPSEGERAGVRGLASLPRPSLTPPANPPPPPTLAAGSGRTNIFIYPPFSFRIADALLTNFHLPCSTLLMLVCAFAAPGGTGGRERVLAAYAEAIRLRYRFFSYGDAMLIL